MRRGASGFSNKPCTRTSGASTTPPRPRSGRRNPSGWGLSVLSVDGGGPGETTGTVEFVATYRTGDDDIEHHERAEFRRDGDTWYFWDGRILGDAPIEREEPKVGRNDPCPCGSGKKFKKCCG